MVFLAFYNTLYIYFILSLQYKGRCNIKMLSHRTYLMENFVMRKVNREEKRIKAATKDWRLNINVLSSSHCNRLHRIHAKEKKTFRLHNKNPLVSGTFCIISYSASSFKIHSFRNKIIRHSLCHEAKQSKNMEFMRKN